MPTTALGWASEHIRKWSGETAGGGAPRALLTWLHGAVHREAAVDVAEGDEHSDAGAVLGHIPVGGNRGGRGPGDDGVADVVRVGPQLVAAPGEDAVGGGGGGLGGGGAGVHLELRKRLQERRA